MWCLILHRLITLRRGKRNYNSYSNFSVGKKWQPTPSPSTTRGTYKCRTRIIMWLCVSDANDSQVADGNDITPRLCTVRERAKNVRTTLAAHAFGHGTSACVFRVTQAHVGRKSTLKDQFPCLRIHNKPGRKEERRTANCIRHVIENYALMNLTQTIRKKKRN